MGVHTLHVAQSSRTTIRLQFALICEHKRDAENTDLENFQAARAEYVQPWNIVPKTPLAKGTRTVLTFYAGVDYPMPALVSRNPADT